LFSLHHHLTNHNRHNQRHLLLFFLVGPTSRRRWPSRDNICLALLGPRFTDGLEGLQLIQQLSEVVLQLIHNIVGSKGQEGRGERLQDDTHLSLLVDGGPMYLRLVDQVDHVQNMPLTEEPFFILVVR